MDYMKRGSLAELISKKAKGFCPEYDNTKRQIILIGISRGMMLLHKLHIIHRDLKPENILLDDDLYPHITDFGISKFFDPNHSTSQSMGDIGTVAYMAPEVINDNHYNTKADVYSFGILMLEVLTGQRAYKSLLHGENKLNPFQFKQKVCEGLRPEIEEGSIKRSHQIMIEKCLSKNPKDRPTFSELYRKLSLSTDDFIDFEVQESNVIDYEEDNCEDSDDDDDDEIGFDKTFCLDSVDYEAIFEYINVIREEPKRYEDSSKSSSDANKEEIEQMKKTIKKLEQKTEEQASVISELSESVISMKNSVECLKHELKKTKSDLSYEKQQKKEIYQLREEINKKVAEQQKEILDLRKEVEQVKSEKISASQLCDENATRLLEDDSSKVKPHQHLINDIDTLQETLQMFNKKITEFDIFNDQTKEFMNGILEMAKKIIDSEKSSSDSKECSEILAEITSNIDDSSDSLENITEQFKESLNKLINYEQDNLPSKNICKTQEQHRIQISEIDELPGFLRDLEYEIDDLRSQKKLRNEPIISSTEELEMIKNEITEKIYEIRKTLQCLKHEIKKIKASM